MVEGKPELNCAPRSGGRGAKLQQDRAADASSRKLSELVVSISKCGARDGTDKGNGPEISSPARPDVPQRDDGRTLQSVFLRCWIIM
jgi:hypothetical protein